jgi:hypothetical protein
MFLQANYWPTSTVCLKIMSKGNCVAKKKRKKSNNKKISLKICTKQGVNLKIRWGSGSPEGLDWVTQHCTFCEVMIRVIVSSAVVRGGGVCQVPPGSAPGWYDDNADEGLAVVLYC